MSFQIIATSNGPVVKLGEELATLQEISALFDVADEHETFIPELKVHIANEAINSVNLWCEALMGNVNPVPPTQRVSAYLNAGNQMRSFESQYNSYVSQRTAAAEESAP